MTNTPRRFDENPNTTTNLQKDSTEYFGISQSGASKVIKTADAFTKANVGLSEVDNTSDANKPVSVAQQTALDLKADKSELLALGEVTGTAYDGAKGKANADNIQDLDTNKADKTYTEILHSESIKADKDLQSQVTTVRKVSSQAIVETYNGEDIVNDNEVSIVGKADDGIIDVSEIVVDGELDIELKGKTISDLIDGTTNTVPKKITVTGKNLFNKNSVFKESYVYRYDTGVGLSNEFNNTYQIRVLQLTTYNKTVASWTTFWDKNFNFISGIDSGTVFTTPSNCAYIRDSVLKGNETTYQVEIGTVATTYEPYSETVAKVPVELRSVPSIADYFDVTSGVHTKHIKKYTLVEEDIIAVGTFFTNVDYIITRVFTDLISQSTEVGGSVAIKELEEIDWGLDSLDSIGKFATRNDNVIAFYVAKGTTLVQAKTDLVGTIIRYQLATPVITQYEPQPLLATKGSQIQIESFESKVVSNSNGTITFDYDIESVEHVYRYDTGVEVETTDYTFTNNILTVNNVTDLIVVSADVYLKNSTDATIVSQVAVDNLVSRIAKLEALVATLI